MLEILSGIVVMTIIGTISYLMRLVDITGLIAGFGVGTVIWYFGGIGPFLLVLGFFVASGLATKYKYRRKKRDGVAQVDKGKRNWRNILGSGTVPAILSMVMFAVQSMTVWFFVAYVAFSSSVATTTADTLATEIGVLSKSRPRMINNWARRVPRGTAGGVSGLGLKVELIVALIFGLAAALFYLVGAVGWIGVSFEITAAWLIGPFVAFTGFMGANIDSLIGAMNRKFDWRMKSYLVNFGSSVIGGMLGFMVATGLLLVVIGCFVTWGIIAGSS